MGKHPACVGLLTDSDRWGRCRGHGRDGEITVLRSSRSCAFGDYDNDGDVDVIANNMNEIPSVLRNHGGNKNNWTRSTVEPA